MAAVSTALSKDVGAALKAVGAGDTLSDAGFAEVAHCVFSVLCRDGRSSEEVLEGAQAPPMLPLVRVPQCAVSWSCGWARTVPDGGPPAAVCVRVA